MSQEVPDKLLYTFKETEKAILLATSLCEDSSRAAAEATRISTAAANATEKAGALLHELRREVALTILMNLITDTDSESTSK
jgi:hypothetical protein